MNPSEMNEEFMDGQGSVRLTHMSHEIRTPLNGIKGVLDVLKERPELAGDKYLEDALVSTRHLMNIVNNILDMSKLSNGGLVLERTWCPRKKFVQQILAIMEPIAREKGVELCYPPGDTYEDRAIYIDTDRMKQVLINLLSNAVKYTPGGGRVEYRDHLEELGGGRTRCTIHIADNGIGMDPEFVRVAFEPFVREQRGNGIEGTGLGLPITRQLIEAMDGTIFIESTPGAGTNVKVEFETETRTGSYEEIEETVAADNAGHGRAYRREEAQAASQTGCQGGPQE